MNQPLFIDPSIKMEKRAYDIRLDDEPEEWPVSVVRESYKQLPFLKSFETEVEFDKLDTARGYAVGKMLVWPTGVEKTAAAESKQLITVPLIVRDREMSPLDVYTHEGEMRPMDQDKVASILFRPQVFQGVAPRDQFMGTNLYGQLTPPNTDHQYNAGTLAKHGHVKTAFLGGGKSLDDVEEEMRLDEIKKLRKQGVPEKEIQRRWGAETKLVKESSALWGEAVRTFRQKDVDAFGEKLASSPALRHAFTTSEVLRSAVADIVRNVGTEKTAAAKRAERLAHTKPTVVQVVEAENGYLVKTANRHCYVEQAKVASRFEVQKLLGGEAFKRLLDEGRVTYSTDPVQDEAVVEKTAQDADRIGYYAVSRSGQSAHGVVIPRMVDFDGNPLSMQLFAGDDCHALQEKVAGVFVGDVVVRSSEPRGPGVFVYQEGPHAFATEPVRIEDKVKVAHQHGASVTLLGTRMATGQPMRVSVVPGLQKMAMVGSTELALPEHFRFLSLKGKQVGVSSTPGEAQAPETTKVAGAESVELISDGSFYSLRGHNAEPLFKDVIMDAAEAEFALCALGLTGAQASGMLKTASVKSSVIIARTHKVVPEDAVGFEAITKAASAVASTPHLQVELLDELAVLVTPPRGGLEKVSSTVLGKETVDTILSLGFVTPENAHLYVGYLPELEKVSSRLAELLVASRLGMDDVRESAAKNAMTQVNAVVRGLETLRERIN